jgi:hypothetical protein
MKLRGFVPNIHILVSVSDLCIPTIRLPILLHQNSLVQQHYERLVFFAYVGSMIQTPPPRVHI